MNHNPFDLIKNKNLKAIAEKVYEDIPVDEKDALFMLTTTDILELGLIAHFVRKRLHGDIAYYSLNMNLNYTNVCELRCPLCAFSRSEGDEGAYTMTLDEIEKRIRDMVLSGIEEVHIVGGLNPKLKIDYFEEMLKRIKSIKQDIFIVAFTAVEYDYFARINNMTVEEVLTRMKDAGLGALPGGGSEIFEPEIRRVIAPKKISGERWLQVMKIAHGLGLKTNATLLYNHIEKPRDIVHHLLQVRKLQEETGGFKTFVPLPYHDAGRGVTAKRGQSTGFDDIRLFAAIRIFLYNVPHIKALWMYLGEKMAQTLLYFGVDDLGGTYHHEKVVHSAGAATPDMGSELRLKQLIENAGMKAVRAVASYEMRGNS